ncbi:MAG: PQQ-binding-like beta-propeller repeat protein [Verrucomicrobia bacterium]|nr:PQQ-binding-like beta-propeller repeat protein [Verrucomicrobiota bacterium]
MTLRHTLILICCLTSSLSAQWTNWRGPNNNLTTGDEAFPSHFSETENVVWTARIPGEGTSTPAIWGDSLYITCFEDGVDTVIAFDMNGKRKWEAQLGIGTEGSHRAGTGANSSPVVDPSGVYVYFKSGSLAKLSHAGKELWKTNLQKTYSLDGHWWDEGSSPVLEDGKVFVAVMQQTERRDGQKCETYVVAFDKDTGKEAWKVERNTGANVESNDAYTTPLIATIDGQKQLVVWGADQLSGHSLKNGKLIWKCKNFNPTNHKNWRTIASHTIVGDIAIVPYGRGYAVAGIKMSGKGDITENSRLWEIQRIGPDVPTPSVHGNSAIILTDRGVLTAVDIESGDIRWTDNLPRTAAKYFASPMISGDRLICSRDDGTVFVCGLSDDGMDILAENSLGETIIATAVPYQDRLYIRTASKLYCIGGNS